MNIQVCFGILKIKWFVSSIFQLNTSRIKKDFISNTGNQALLQSALLFKCCTSENGM